jgi:hypothetical protein
MQNCSEVFEKLMKIYDCKNLKEFSLKIGKSANWASQLRKRETPPLDLCIETCKKYNLSLDWLLLNKGEQSNTKQVKQKELITNIKESFYECWELDLLPDYPTEIMPAIASLFAKNLEDLIEVSKDKKIKTDNKKAV